VSMLVRISSYGSEVAHAVMLEVMHQYNNVHSGELRNLSALLLELLVCLYEVPTFKFKGFPCTFFSVKNIHRLNSFK